MDAKEKAKDLILSFSILKEGHNHLVKTCALLTVKEVMKAINNVGWLDVETDSSADFWEEVEQEVKLYKD